MAEHIEILEEREARLRRHILGTSLHSYKYKQEKNVFLSLQTKLQELNTQFEKLHTTIPNFPKLLELYTNNKSILDSHLHGTNKFDDIKTMEIQRAMILSYEDHIKDLMNEFQSLQKLQPILPQLNQLHDHQLTYQQDLQRLEHKQSQLSIKILSFHTRLEQLLSTYRKVIDIISEKCALYHAYLDEVEERP